MDLLLLQSPLDSALFFRFSAAIAGSLCAWLAVLTAALSLWKIRSSGSVLPSSSSSSSSPSPAQNPIPKPISAPISPPVSISSTFNSPFTAYYAAGEAEGRDDGSYGADSDPGFGWESLMPVTKTGDEFDCDEVRFSVSDPVFGLQKFMPVRRRAHLGWHRYQDFTVLNGSVVKLWDGQG